MVVELAVVELAVVEQVMAEREVQALDSGAAPAVNRNRAQLFQCPTWVSMPGNPAIPDPVERLGNRVEASPAQAAASRAAKVPLTSPNQNRDCPTGQCQTLA